MKTKNRILAMVVAMITIFTIFLMTVQAEEAEPPTIDAVLEQRKQALLEADLLFEVKYTNDSIVKSGISYTLVVDPFTYIPTLSIIKDLPFGYTIYDNPDTEIIEGIRIGGETVTSLKDIFIPELDSYYAITVKIVYAEGIPGLIAKISDGTVTAEELLANPIILMQLAYYAIAALSIIIGGFGVLRSKKKKVKSADEIAALIDIRTKESIDDMQDKFMKMLDESLLPLVQKTVDTNKQIVKAVTLSTSKMKDAPVALLDTLKEIGDVDVNEMLESAKESVTKNIKRKDKEKEELVEALQNMAMGKKDVLRGNGDTDEVEKKSVF